MASFGQPGWAEEQLDNILDAVLGVVGLDSPMLLARFLFWIIASVSLFSLVLTVGGLFTFTFRRLFAFFTQRVGPNRLPLFGVFYLVADGLKLISKEDITPKNADKWLFKFAPYLAISPFIMAWAPIPFASNMVMSNIGTGIIFVLAISALSPLAEITAGWASNNKYAIYGGIRAAALDFSYEIPMVISVAGVIALAGTMSTVGIVDSQRAVWFIVPQFIGAFIFFAAALAKAGLVPTDLPEAESELVAGYSTEYSGMRFGFFYVVLFAQVFFISALMTTLFLGGWLGPFGSYSSLNGAELGFGVVSFQAPMILAAILGDGVLWFVLKSMLLCFTIFWLWLTVPRVRVDQYLNFAWKVLFPLSLVNFVIAALVRWFILV
jgi:NADH-quinone oxidoreductase subunit H